MKNINIALLGLGTVGSGLVQILKNNAKKIEQNANSRFKITKALVRDINKYRDCYSDDFKLTNNFEDISNDPQIQIVVEVMGGIHPAEEYLEALLKKGKHVVTANKDLMATKGAKLIKLAQDNHVNLMYEASVAGGIPILRALSTSYSGDEIEEISGIVNGTTNYILTRMKEERLSFQDALKGAQDMGFAEADPTNDVSGKDAAFKMIILTAFAFGKQINIDQLSYEGIEDVNIDDVLQVQKDGYVIKLIGTAERYNNQLSVEVAPMLVSQSSQLANVNNEFNAIELKSNNVGDSFFYGPGAGSLPTANSVVSDLIQEARHLDEANAFNSYSDHIKVVSANEKKSKFYVAGKFLNHNQEEINSELISSFNNKDGRISFYTEEISFNVLKKLLKEKGFQMESTYKIKG